MKTYVTGGLIGILGIAGCATTRSGNEQLIEWSHKECATVETCPFEIKVMSLEKNAQEFLFYSFLELDILHAKYGNAEMAYLPDCDIILFIEGEKISSYAQLPSHDASKFESWLNKYYPIKEKETNHLEKYADCNRLREIMESQPQFHIDP